MDLKERLRHEVTVGSGTVSLLRLDAANRIEELEAALREIIADCEADYPPSHGAIKYAARKALDTA